MDDHGYPCLLLWTDSAGQPSVYWNPLYERLGVRFDDLLGAWVVVPDASYVLFDRAREKMAACKRARAIQHAYQFKQVHVYSPSDERQQVVDHRFLDDPPERPTLPDDVGESGAAPSADTDPAVTRTERPTASETDDGEREATADSDRSGTPTTSTPEDVLDAASVDLNAVEAVDTVGPVHHYRAVDLDDAAVNIATVAPEFTSDRTVMSSFMSVATQWREISDAAHVATVHDIGIGPAPWIAYRPGSGTLEDRLDDVDSRTRLRIVADLASALDTATQYNVPRRGVVPGNVRLVPADEGERATLANWGIERDVATAIGETPVTPYTAPEQLDHETTPTTGIYQLGALTYRLLVDRVPFSDPVTLEATIERGDLTPASEIRDLPQSVDRVLARAMDPEPRDRYTSASTFQNRLFETLR